MDKPKFKLKRLLLWSVLTTLVVVVTVLVWLTLFERSHYQFLNEKLTNERQVLVEKGLNEDEIAKELNELEIKIRIINQMRRTHEEDAAHWKNVKIKMSVVGSLSAFFVFGPIIYFMFFLTLIVTYRFKTNSDTNA